MWGGDGGLLPETASRFFITVLMHDPCAGMVFRPGPARVCGNGAHAFCEPRQSCLQAGRCLQQSWRKAPLRGSAFMSARACRTSRRQGVHATRGPAQNEAGMRQQNLQQIRPLCDD